MEKILGQIRSATFKSTLVYYAGSFLNNFGRYLFHLLLLRLLTPGEYGEFLSYLSLIYLLGIPTATIGQVVIKEVSEMYGKNNRPGISNFFFYINKTFSPISFIAGLAIILFSGTLSTLFKAHQVAFIILGFSLSISVAQTAISSFLVALQKFVLLTVLGFVGVILTLIFAFTLIRSGYSAGGAVAAQIIAGIVISIISFYSIKSYIFPRYQEKHLLHPNFKKFAGYSLLFAIGSMSLISTDVLVVRAVSDTHTSGLYAALSIIGRSIYFALAPLTALALPIATHRYVKFGTAKSIFYKLGGVIAFLGLGAVLICSIFPSLVIGLLSSKEYAQSANLLPYTSIAMYLYALSQFVMSFFMATNREKYVVILALAALLHPVLIMFFHQSLLQMVQILLFTQVLLFISVLIANSRERHAH